MRWFVAAVAVCCVSVSVADGAISRIAFGSCAFQSIPQSVFRAIADSEPDLYLSLGDAIYADYDLKTKMPYEVTAETLRREWQVLKDSPDWQYLASRVPVMATWDNHDYGHYQAGEEFALKEVSKQIFLDFFGEPKGSVRRTRAGIYDAKIIGPEGRRVQIILLDTRSFKTRPVLAQRPEGAKGSLGKFAPNTDPAASLLGDAQWQWLERELKRPAELRLLVSSTQVVADQKGMDEWGAYPLERQRLLNLLKGLDVDNLIVLSGNAHFAEISEYRAGDFRLIDFTASGLTHTDKKYAQAPNRYRIGNPYTDNNFGLVKIDWLAGGLPYVELVVMDESGKQVLANTVKFTERKGEK
jgi:alkaline phosphatase D